MALEFRPDPPLLPSAAFNPHSALILPCFNFISVPRVGIPFGDHRFRAEGKWFWQVVSACGKPCAWDGPLAICKLVADYCLFLPSNHLRLRTGFHQKARAPTAPHPHIPHPKPQRASCHKPPHWRKWIPIEREKPIQTHPFLQRSPNRKPVRYWKWPQGSFRTGKNRWYPVESSWRN